VLNTLYAKRNIYKIYPTPFTLTEPRMNDSVRFVASRFQIEGKPVTVVPYGYGHIHDTYKVTYQQTDRLVHFLFQRVNTHVFKEPFGLMENVDRVCTHLQHKYQILEKGSANLPRLALTLIRTHDNQPFFENDDHSVWRVYHFIEGATSHNIIQNTQQAFTTADIFGEFQKLLVDLPGKRLNNTLPDFHNTPKRYSDLKVVVLKDPLNRAIKAKKEIEFAHRHEVLASALDKLYHDGKIPERITHNDAKLNNVLIDNETQKALCIIDLDTVMPGLSLHDFGDLVRSATSPTGEDEQDLSKVTMQLPVFQALADGYLSSAGHFLTEVEKTMLPLSGKVITFEIGIRFLTDFLNGDIYFKTHRTQHNLDRCRTQFRLIESMIEQEEAMNRAVENMKNKSF